MRLSDTLLLQHVDGPDRSLFVVVEQSHGGEVEMTASDFARLIIGATYFMSTVPELHAAVITATQQLDGGSRQTAREALSTFLADIAEASI
jgi:hypothetical protein